MTTPQPVFQHPFRAMASDLFDVAHTLVEDVAGLDLDLNDDPPNENSPAGRVVKVASELRALANALDITQGNSAADSAPQWAQDLALSIALDSIAHLIAERAQPTDLATQEHP